MRAVMLLGVVGTFVSGLACAQSNKPGPGSSGGYEERKNLGAPLQTFQCTADGGSKLVGAKSWTVRLDDAAQTMTIDTPDRPSQSHRAQTVSPLYKAAWEITTNQTAQLTFDRNSGLWEEVVCQGSTCERGRTMCKPA